MNEDKKGTPQYKSRFTLKNERKMAFVPSGSNYFSINRNYRLFIANRKIALKATENQRVTT
jgi:hypothetical protein